MFSGSKWAEKSILNLKKILEKLKMPFSATCLKMSPVAHFCEKAILAIFRRLQLRRVLTVWAENYVRALSYPKELPYQFSAQTNNTRRRWSTLKNAILGLKGYTLQILTIFQAAPKKAFLGTLGFSSGRKSIFQLILTQKTCSDVQLGDFWKIEFLSFLGIFGSQTGSQPVFPPIFSLRGWVLTFENIYVF